MVGRRSFFAALPAAVLLSSSGRTAGADLVWADGIMHIALDGQQLVVDTNDVPEVVQVQDEETPSLRLWVSRPDETARYLIIGRHGTLEVSTLSRTCTTWLPHDPKRTGSVQWSEPGHKGILKYSQIVRVLGRVLEQ